MSDDAPGAGAKEDRRARAKRLVATGWARLRGGELSPRRAAASVAVGLAIGVLPLWGTHWALVLAVCVPLRLDTAVAYLAANVSIPPVAPFITMAELELGSRILTGAWMHVTVEAARALTPGALARELAVGAAAMAALSAAVGGALTWGVAHAVRAVRRRERA
ncbi:MAG: DUF2062 domain-containing protein [Polyangiaceae bacterium]